MGLNGVRRLALLLALSGPPAVLAGAPEFSWMTLNGLTRVALVVEGITPELESYGLKSAPLQAHLVSGLSRLGLTLVTPAEARTLPDAAQLKLDLVCNRDPHGYFFNVKLNLRRKIPLGNPAGGFVSQLAWSDGESGMMQANESARVRDAVDRLLEHFTHDYRTDNTGARPE